MIHEKVIRRDDGSSVKIAVYLTSTSGDLMWRWCAYHRPRRARTWTPAFDVDSREASGMYPSEKREEERRRSLLLVTEAEVEETMRELIAKIVPRV